MSHEPDIISISLFRLITKENVKALCVYYCSILRWIRRRSDDSPHTGLIMWKAFSYHDVIMKIPWLSWVMVRYRTWCVNSMAALISVFALVVVWWVMVYCFRHRRRQRTWNILWVDACSSTNRVAYISIIVLIQLWKLQRIDRLHIT